MRALVAGAAGFLGSHLCDRLRHDGFEVLGFDNFCTGRRQNIKHLESDSGFRFFEHDITRPIEATMAGPLDVIFNMACPASPLTYQRDPLFTLETNYVGVRNLLELARHKAATILQASTSEIYGDPTVHPQVESYWGNVNCFGVRSCYDEGKRVAETLMLEYARRYGVRIKVVRIFNTYGPRMDPQDGRIVSRFIDQALRGDPITIFGDGHQTRSFCYVDDLIDGLVRMAGSDPLFTGPVNLGSPGELTVNEAASIIKEMTRSSSAIIYQPLPSDDPKQRKPDIGLAEATLSWRPQIPFVQGVARTIDYFQGIAKGCPASSVRLVKDVIVTATTKTPVVFIVFNRPDTTRQVFEAIRAAKPRQLLVIADGPRANRPGEAEKCSEVRAIIDEVDWDCDVQKHYSESNMGCRLRVSTGITWAFELVDKAIILEDDCVPSASFFRYCADLLDRYEADERVMMISGDNHLFGHASIADSYYFSRYPHVWGWATWKRAWATYDLNMIDWPEIRNRRTFDQYLPMKGERYHWECAFQSAYDGNIDTWDYQWVYSIWLNSGLCVTPARNLVHNIGFDAEATHTAGETVYSALVAEELEFPLIHPKTLVVNSDRDRLEAKLRIVYSNKLPYHVNVTASAIRLLVRRAIWRGQVRHSVSGAVFDESSPKPMPR